MIDITFAVKIFVFLILLDLSWIIFIFAKPFSNMIKDVQGSEMIISSRGAVIAYIVLFFYILFTLPRTNNDMEAFLLGFLTYGVYDSTNFATLKNWNPMLAIIDSIWGGLLFLLLRKLTLN
jgi:uncharacterized membrane protein